MPWPIWIFGGDTIRDHSHHPSYDSKTNKPVRCNMGVGTKVEPKSETVAKNRKFMELLSDTLAVVGMRKRLHIATLGLYQNILVEYVITRRGADKVAIVYTKGNERNLDSIMERLEDNMIPVISRKVPPWDYHEVLSGILEIVSDHEDYDIEYNISCGTRVMTTAAYLAALFTDSPVYFVMYPGKQ